MVNQVAGFAEDRHASDFRPDPVATVVKDPDNPEQTIGVVTARNAHGIARRYRAIINGPEDVFTRRTQQIRAGFDIVEKGVADGKSLLEAVKLAALLTRSVSHPA